ncbi:hypothetical protein M0813_01549 [Anaeramoeba flamelloides]|uniref:Peptidase C1A papain C-terminal domain-containing protein n=1 Tax=Anaeramoeba flamelloides TaxID=1746091 RepID=A0AAV7Z413_9EUKA|nr:hypothetical protein M0812_18883 [Anaeramoeba flamelloides]KAJ6251779.1 hypothetical protein M0813_01549 [Anaeramoeba flamelloides]
MIKIILLIFLISVCYSLPTNFDWRNVNGKNYCTVVRQQHLPQYCGSCWCLSSTSALNDRIKIKYNNSKLDINLSPQYIINCGNAGSCEGGHPDLVYDFILQNGAVHETCCPYQAKDMECTAENICKRCPSYGKPCYAVETPKRWYISSHGAVIGEQAMMNEIYKNGPIVCRLLATDPLESWNGGDEVFTTDEHTDNFNHLISVVGWGVDSKTNQPYWIVRNSWGVEWNPTESSGGGFFNLLRGDNSLAIESKCFYAIPK